MKLIKEEEEANHLEIIKLMYPVRSVPEWIFNAGKLIQLIKASELVREE
jgi:hypothetical protein